MPCTAAMAMCAASVAAFRGSLPEDKMAPARVETSGVMSSRGRSWIMLKRVRAGYRVPFTRLVNDELRDVKLQAFPFLSHHSRVIC